MFYVFMISTKWKKIQIISAVKLPLWSYWINRVATGRGKVRGIQGQGKVREF